jgi:hypothetical protein
MAFTWLTGFTVDGNVGVGTISPNQLLEVAKSSGGATINISTDQSAGSQASKKYVTLDFSGYNNDVMARIQSWDESSSTGHGYLTFSTRKAGVGLSQAMLIDENGNVGVGTDNPSGKLSVEGTGGAGVPTLDVINTSILQFNHSAEFITPNMTDEQNNILVIGRASSTKNAGYIGWKYKGGAGSNENILTFGHWGSDNLMNLDGVGNLGIGTQTPTAPLHFGKTVYGAPSSENFFRVKFFDNGGIMNDVGIGQPTSGAIGWNIIPNSTGYYEWNSGTRGRIMNLDYLGKLTLDDYDGTNQTGTPTYLLGTDASGIVVKTLSTPGGDPGPYLPLAGGTMLGDIQMSGNNLKFDQSGTRSWNINASSGKLNITSGDSLGVVRISSGLEVDDNITIDSALLSNQENTDVDTGTETIAEVAVATYTAAFCDCVVKKTTNVRSGTVYACHDGTNVQFTETSTQDLGNTSDVVLSVDISGGQMRLRATVASDDWSVKSLIRAI